MMFSKWKGVLGVAALLATLGTAQLSATPVALRLSILVDTSGSIDGTEFSLQRNGYKNAFNSASVINAITGLGPSGIAVNYIEWSGVGEFVELIPFTHLTNAASIQAFGNLITTFGRSFSGSTGPGSVLPFARDKITNSGFESARTVVDISGDGRQNVGPDTLTAVNNLRSTIAGSIVNGLAILGEADLQAWYQANIVTPGGGTLYIASDFNSFETALIAKLGGEIVGTTGTNGTTGGEVPEPSTYVLMSTGVALLVAARFRTKA